MFTKQRMAKYAAWIGGVLLAASQYGLLGKHSAAIGLLLMSSGVHLSSNTSVDRPNG